MKNFILTTIMLFILQTNLFSQENLKSWLSYKELYAISQDNLINKPVFVFIGKNNCPYCKKEIERIKNSKEFSKYLNNNFITVFINQDEDFIPVDLYSEMVPAFYILEPYSLRKLVKPGYGAIPINSLQNWLKNISIKFNKYQKKVK